MCGTACQPVVSSRSCTLPHTHVCAHGRCRIPHAGTGQRPFRQPAGPGCSGRRDGDHGLRNHRACWQHPNQHTTRPRPSLRLHLSSSIAPHPPSCTTQFRLLPFPIPTCAAPSSSWLWCWSRKPKGTSRASSPGTARSEVERSSPFTATGSLPTTPWRKNAWLFPWENGEQHI